MAKKKARAVNKSQTIRAYKKTHPKLKPKQIAEDLGRKGLTVTPGFVSSVLSSSKRKKKIGKPGRPKGSKSTPSTSAVGRPPKSRSAANGASVSLDSLLKFKDIVSELGGIDEARTALAALEKLMR